MKPRAAAFFVWLAEYGGYGRGPNADYAAFWVKNELARSNLGANPSLTACQFIFYSPSTSHPTENFDFVKTNEKKCIKPREGLRLHAFFHVASCFASLDKTGRDTHHTQKIQRGGVCLFLQNFRLQT